MKESVNYGKINSSICIKNNQLLARLMKNAVLNKSYDPSNIEDKWYKKWVDSNYFNADETSNKKPYTIVIPPPNVTGILHLGHVLNNTIQDILIRKARMEGKEACWIPGTDHASISTEAKVVSMLQNKGIKKNDLTRAEFLKYAMEWKDEYGGIIIKQLKKLGCSCDWDREKFTMDEEYSKSVLTAFVKLYKKGLIYRGNRLVNWCPKSRSAISDEEVIHKEVKGKLWYLKYPIIDSDQYLTVATTRPETMLGDSAVAINPKDKRFKKYIGSSIILPLTNREIPIISDEFVDPEFGTGCVKVTPAHDPNDFAMGERHGLKFINIMNDDASLNKNVPKKYEGLSREKARKIILEDINELGLLEKVEDYTNKVGFSERGGVPIEFYMSKQWFMKMSKLAEPAMDAVNEGKITFHPSHWSKTYNHWMKNIKDWCISRQLWWGHQLPVWYNKNDDSEIHVSIDGPNDVENWVQDPDVLDTWASSWLWPIGVHGWPDENDNLNKFYPTDTLVTGPDIIFFWVARMIMSGYEFKGEIPFKDVYFTSILRDETGKKLSKSLGNSPDPFELFEEYGTDAVRFGTMLMAPQGLDVLFAKERLEVGRNFMNKLWNACRFIQLNIPENWNDDIKLDFKNLDLPEKWILDQLSETINNFNNQIDRFYFNEAAKIIYDYTWNDFCDWYIEIIKIRFYSQDEHQKNIARSVAIKCIKSIITLLHPYTPFITEELWSYFKENSQSDLIISSWIKPKAFKKSKNIQKEMDFLKSIVTSIRSIRSRMNVPFSKKVDLTVRCNKKVEATFNNHKSLIISLANLNNISLGEKIERPSQSSTAVVEGAELFIPLGGLIDIDQEKARMEKRILEINRLLSSINGKLANENFINRAPESVIMKEKSNLNKLTDELEKVNSNLKILA
ncbi:MAG: valine--tRNA ligase [Candidatus Neomarinimicrobiota bacterium]